MKLPGEGKSALVTGGSRGIGRGVALTLASYGYDLAIGHYDEKEEAEAVAHRIESEFGRKCLVYQGNLEDAETPVRIAESAVKELGHVDVLVNNAGLTITGDITEMPLASMNTLLHLNFRAPLLLMQTIGKHMKEQGIKGSMFNIASSRGERAYPRDAVYGGVKAALIRATQSIALDLAPYGIRVNSIGPGATRVRDTHLEFYEKLGSKIPLGRMGTPQDIGEAIAWLASDQASYITGINLRIDGGLILPGMPEDVRPEAGYGWGTFNRK